MKHFIGRAWDNLSKLLTFAKSWIEKFLWKREEYYILLCR